MLCLHVCVVIHLQLLVRTLPTADSSWSVRAAVTTARLLVEAKKIQLEVNRRQSSLVSYHVCNPFQDIVRLILQ